MGKYLKSIGKAAKYVGLTLAGGAVTGVSAELGDLAEALVAAGASELIASLIAAKVVPVAGGFLSILLQQIIKHRDKIGGDSGSDEE